MSVDGQAATLTQRLSQPSVWLIFFLHTAALSRNESHNGCLATPYGISIPLCSRAPGLIDLLSCSS